MAKQEKSAAEIYRDERKARIAKAAKQREKKKTHVAISKKGKAAIAIVVVIALVAGIAAFSLNNAGIIQKSRIAMTVGDVEVTQPEYNFYYTSLFSNYFNMSYQYDSYYGAGMGAMYTGYNYAVAPDVQAYQGEIEGLDKEDLMWTDFFEYSTQENLKLIKASVAYAAENDITLTDEDLATVQETLDSIQESADSSNYSVAAYLRAFYGKGVTESLVKTIVEEQTLATRVSTVKTDEFTAAYTDKEVQDEYVANIENFGKISLRNYVFMAETEEVEEGEEAAAPTDEAMLEAREQADAFAKLATDENSFKNEASKIEKANGNEDYAELITDDSLTLLADTSYSELQGSSQDEDFLDWAKSEKTAVGSTFVVENADTGYTVYMMVDPMHTAPDAQTYDVRHILVKFPEDDAEDAKEETEKEYAAIDFSTYKDATVDLDVTLEDAKDQDTFDKAQNILKEYLDGEQTAENFGALALKYTEDSNGEAGGLYEDVAIGDMVSEFESWSIDETRKAGDVGIVETDYGYHIMYYVGQDVTTWKDTVKESLAQTDLAAFNEDLAAADNVKIDNVNETAFTDVETQVVDLANTQIRNAQQSAAQ